MAPPPVPPALEVMVSVHAVDRYRQHVADVAPDAARAAMLTPAVYTAAAFGARFVRLAGGQRLVIRNGAITTVLPADHPRGRLDPQRDHDHD